MSERVLSVPVSEAVFGEIRDKVRNQVFLDVCLDWFRELEAVLGHEQLEAVITGTASKPFTAEFRTEGDKAGLCASCEVFLTYGCGFPSAEDKEEKACFVLNVQNKVKEEKVC